jgi:hypothetical protein
VNALAGIKKYLDFSYRSFSGDMKKILRVEWIVNGGLSLA